MKNESDRDEKNEYNDEPNKGHLEIDDIAQAADQIETQCRNSRILRQINFGKIQSLKNCHFDSFKGSE